METINTPQIVADLRIEYTDGQNVLVQVPASASFKKFYQWCPAGGPVSCEIDRNFGTDLGKVNGLADTVYRYVLDEDVGCLRDNTANSVPMSGCENNGNPKPQALRNDCRLLKRPERQG